MNDILDLQIVMIARDRPRHTSQSIHSLVEQEGQLRRAGLAVEIVLVDDASQDETREIIEGSGFHYIRNEEPRGPGGARNCGVREADRKFGRSTAIYFSDNDVYFKSFAIEMILASLFRSLDLGFRVVSGYTHPYSQTIRQHHIGHGMFLHEKDSVGGLSRVLTRHTWEEIGPFLDDAKGVRQSEDWEWDQRVKKAGFRVGTLHPAIVFDTGRTDTFGVEVPGAEHIPDVEGVMVK